MNAVTRPNPGREFGHQLIEMKGQLAQALPAGIAPDRFIRVTLTAIQLQPELLECERKSLLLACIRAANDGLMPDGREGAFVIYRDKKRNLKTATWMPMYQGLLKKVRNTGELLSISANVVYERDLFDYELGDQERVTHKPAMGDRGKPIAVYAIARLKGGAIEREIMTWAEIMKIRALGAMNGPWVQWETEQARKTVIRRLYKRLPSSTEMDRYLNAVPVIEREIAPTIADQLQHAALPDPASYESSTFHLITDARLAISEAETAEQVNDLFGRACAALVEMECEVPEELKAARDERLKALAG